MVEPTTAAALVVGAVVAIGATYSYLSGNSSSVEVDADSDGEPELSVDFGDKSLTDVKGIGDTRAIELVAEGFGTVEAVYQASDEELTEVEGIGPYTVEQIRSDIGRA